MNQKLFYWDEPELWKTVEFSVSSLYILCIKSIVLVGSEDPVVHAPPPFLQLITNTFQLNQKAKVVHVYSITWLFFPQDEIYFKQNWKQIKVSCVMTQNIYRDH